MAVAVTAALLILINTKNNKANDDNRGYFGPLGMCCAAAGKDASVTSQHCQITVRRHPFCDIAALPNLWPAHETQPQRVPPRSGPHAHLVPGGGGAQLSGSRVLKNVVVENCCIRYIYIYVCMYLNIMMVTFLECLL